MPLSEKHVPIKRSAVLKHCRICDTTKHICSFSHSAYTYCNNVCNSCFLHKLSINTSIFLLNFLYKIEWLEKNSPRASQKADCLMDKMFNGVMSDSDTISTDETIEMEMSQYVVPYSKWINVKLFDINACDDSIIVAKVVSSSF